MALEDEMRREIKRIEEELFLIEKELSHLSSRVEQLAKIKQKKERDLGILRSHFNMINGATDEEKKKIQTTLANM